MREIIVIAHDMRSTFNVGSLMRTCEGLGVSKLYLTGYTAYPKLNDDTRLPHLADKLDKQIKKTSLGAESSLLWEYRDDVMKLIKELEQGGVTVAALEQSGSSVILPDYQAPENVALVLGTEVAGLPKELLDRIPIHLEIPMQGNKESFNVVIAAAMALYHLRFR